MVHEDNIKAHHHFDLFHSHVADWLCRVDPSMVNDHVLREEKLVALGAQGADVSSLAKMEPIAKVGLAGFTL